MKRILYTAFFCAILFSCKKSDTDDGKINPGDPDAVSENIRVWHGVRTPGALPAPTSHPNSPVLDDFTNNEEITAIAGRYAIVFPAVTYADNLAGYYVKVRGANEYFKVDYSRPRSTERSAPMTSAERRRETRLNGAQSALRITNNTLIDSALVIAIPDDIQPGTFCIEYVAFDSMGYISNVITTCINITQFGGDASTSYLTGTWRFNAERFDPTEDWDTSWYDYSPHVEIDSVFCNYDSTNNYYYYDGVCYTSGCSAFVDTLFHYQYLKDDLIFGSNGGLRYESKVIDKEMIGYGTSCGNAQMEDYGYEDFLEGAWSYEPNGSKLYLIFDLDYWGFPDPQMMEFKLIKESNTVIYLEDEYGFQYRLKK